MLRNESPNAISEVTRRNLFDEMRLSNVNWSGRLPESEFLGRIFDLKKMPSDDPRQSDMASDIWRHRERFADWPDDWVYDDSRLNLLRCPDEAFLTFLCEMIHPVVRPNDQEAARLAAIFNRHLAADGYEVSPRTTISGKAIYSGRPSVAAIDQRTPAARRVADELSSEYLSRQITRMESSIKDDPALAIGSAKEFVESICKGILTARGVTPSGAESIQQLVKMTREAVGFTAEKTTEEAIKKAVNGLATAVQGIAELRGQLGSGHGHHPATATPRPEIAHFAVNSAVAIGVFLYELHRQAPPAAEVKIA